ncbi:hypothetical protein JRQ81_009133 [Phrynocephalus forsythii]|uniref:Transmembrane protein 181 n=1 Tax=Phrynocephalus forsythii TaxID=171643 RepID=A0A9Q0Y5D5_9SAUR|nr:hypothetical protein JRQ81_009133 [Phrynocephalus forsythii]
MSGCGMEADYPAFENPLCGELKHICKRLRETYKEIKEDLTPYKDDRYYRLAPMRLYTLSKRHFVLVFVVFFICFGLTLLIGITGPNVIDSSQETIWNNNSKIKMFNISSKPLSTYNQQLWLMCKMQLGPPYDDKLKNFKVSFNMLVIIRGVIDNASVNYFNKEKHNRTRILSCSEQCAEIIVVHLGYLNYTRYYISVGFENLPINNIKSYTFIWKTYNPSFSQVEIWFRFVFVVLTFIVTVSISALVYSNKRFGDPFFPLSFLINSWFPGMLDDFFQSLFLCALLLFWLCVYHGIRVQGERKCLTFYFPKLLIVGLLWLASVTLGIWQTANELHDPTYQYGIDTNSFQGMKIFFLVVASVYILYLLFLIIRACSELRNMPYVDLRLKFLTALTFVVLVIRGLYFPVKYLMQFGLQYGVLIYHVASDEKDSESQLKDNPAFSMLNDSDDDVIYGSDYEEMPLQNGQAIRAKYKEESDSD